MPENRGKDFLFSPECGFISGENGEQYRYSDGSGYYKGNDGSEGYIYSDGSGYFHGADGSDGYIYSDGSAYFHGADGSEGRKYSDGSGYYRGADGSEGHKYPDGSGTFSHGLDDSNSCYHGNSEESNSSSGWGETIGTIIGAGVACAAQECMRDDCVGQERKAKRTREQEIRDWRLSNPKGQPMECVRETGISQSTVYKWWDDCSPIKTRTKEFIKKDNDEKYAWFALAGMALVVFLIFLLVFAIPSCTDQANKSAGLLCAGSYEDMVGEKYEAVKSHLEAVGFTNIELVDLNDSGLAFWTNGVVKEVVIEGNASFGEHDWFEPNAKIVIIYH